MPENSPLVSVVMGSHSDWDCMQHATELLESLRIPHEAQVISAHRTPDLLFDFAKSAKNRGIQVIIAGAGGAAHLPGMMASQTSVIRTAPSLEHSSSTARASRSS